MKKFVSVLRFYLRGIRFYGCILALLLTWAMLCGVIAYGKLQYIRADLDTVKDIGTENAYLLMYFPNMEDMKTGSDGVYAQTVEQELEANAAVEHVFSIRVASPVSVGDKAASIVLYEPEMLSYFPVLMENGLDFSLNPDGCILGSKQFYEYDVGANIPLNFSGKKVNVPVAGRLRAPFHWLTLSVASTIPMASDLLKEGEALIMQSTDTVMENVAACAKRITYDSNLIVVFQEGTAAAQCEQILSEIADKHLFYSFDAVIANTDAHVSQRLKQELPLPLFLACTSIFAVLSITVLVFKKKRQDLAILYLCGYSRRKCAWINFTACQLFVLIPIIINIIFIQVWPGIDWYFSLDPNIPGVVLRLTRLYQLITVSNACLIVVAVYYIITVVVSLAVTVGAMVKHTPTTYRKGAL